MFVADSGGSISDIHELLPKNSLEASININMKVKASSHPNLLEG
jgi:hypothetical protein